MQENRIDIITLGCSKNLVDSEKLQRSFWEKGYECILDADVVEGKTVVINTCGFIEDAKQESIDTILQFVQAKEKGEIQRLYVMGCLSQRYLDELEEEIPQVDKYYGKFDYLGLLKDIEPYIPHTDKSLVKNSTSYYRYIKISEGCDRKCAYCAIPIITGKQQSRTIEDILAEVRQYVKEGVKEFQIIAQELTFYGVDIYGERRLPELIDKMSDIDGVEWIRLHYAYPNQFPMDLLKVMREKKNVCKYLDVALQHISTPVLKRMLRNTTKEDTMKLIEQIRKEVPGINLRTTLMVGFPGETEEDFQELIDFVKWARFERMGAFAYSEEDGTYAAQNYKDDVPEDVKRQRLDKLMRVQQRISMEMQEAQINKKMRVIIDNKENDWYVARSEFSSPEVDPEILIPVSEGTLAIGQFYNVEITGAEEFDLYAKLI